MKLKKAQSELVGFGLIIVIVAVLILVFLSFSLNKSEEPVQNYELETFIQASLEYTTDCAISYSSKLVSLRRLIKECSKQSLCVDGNYSCDVLNNTLTGILENSWKVGPEWPAKAYSLNITSSGQPLFELEKGNKTTEIKGAVQNFENIDIYFKIYS
jgi:competence protein ComGC